MWNVLRCALPEISPPMNATRLFTLSPDNETLRMRHYVQQISHNLAAMIVGEDVRRRSRDAYLGDERVLGSSAFVEQPRRTVVVASRAAPRRRIAPLRWGKEASVGEAHPGERAHKCYGDATTSKGLLYHRAEETIGAHLVPGGAPRNSEQHNHNTAP